VCFLFGYILLGSVPQATCCILGSASSKLHATLHVILLCMLILGMLNLLEHVNHSEVRDNVVAWKKFKNKYKGINTIKIP
jgi:hypothetical protein